MSVANITNFSGTPVSGSAPLTVSFTDLSSPTPSSWLWDFGDGNTSTVQNPSHTYTVAGTYNVSLSPSAPHPTTTKTAYISVTLSGTDYTLQPTDCGKETRVTNSTPFTNVHVPTDAEQPNIAIGMTFRVKSISSSALTIVNDSVTLNTSSALAIPQFGVVRLTKVAANEWDMDPIVSAVSDTDLVPSTPIKPAPMTVSNNASTAFDFGSAADHNTSYRMTASSAITVTVRPDAFWTGPDLYYTNNFNPTNPGPMPVGGSAIFGEVGSGVVSFVADTGVTINTPATLSINKLNGKVTLIKVAANTWDLEGNLN